MKEYPCRMHAHPSVSIQHMQLSRIISNFLTNWQNISFVNVCCYTIHKINASQYTVNEGNSSNIFFVTNMGTNNVQYTMLQIK